MEVDIDVTLIQTQSVVIERLSDDANDQYIISFKDGKVVHLWFRYGKQTEGPLHIDQKKYSQRIPDVDLLLTSLSRNKSLNDQEISKIQSSIYSQLIHGKLTSQKADYTDYLRDEGSSHTETIIEREVDEIEPGSTLSQWLEGLTLKSSFMFHEEYLVPHIEIGREDKPENLKRLPICSHSKGIRHIVVPNGMRYNVQLSETEKSLLVRNSVLFDGTLYLSRDPTHGSFICSLTNTQESAQIIQIERRIMEGDKSHRSTTSFKFICPMLCRYLAIGLHSLVGLKYNHKSGVLVPFSVWYGRYRKNR